MGKILERKSLGWGWEGTKEKMCFGLDTFLDAYQIYLWNGKLSEGQSSIDVTFLPNFQANFFAKCNPK